MTADCTTRNPGLLADEGSSTPPSADPAGLGYWASHPDAWTPEIRARIQATDQRFDGSDGSTPDGQLSAAEVAAAYAVSRGQTDNLRMQLLATYFNLGSRRINAGTVIDSRTASQVGLTTVGAAASYAADTLPLPFGPSTSDRYSGAMRLLARSTTTAASTTEAGSSEDVGSPTSDADFIRPSFRNQDVAPCPERPL